MIKELLSHLDGPRTLGVVIILIGVIVLAILILPYIPPNMRLIAIPIILFITFVFIVIFLMTSDDIND